MTDTTNLIDRLRSYAGTCTGIEPQRILIQAADLLTTQAATIERLRHAIECALKCTPHVQQHILASPSIIYDCGDPWEILLAALKDSPQ